MAAYADCNQLFSFFTNAISVLYRILVIKSLQIAKISDCVYKISAISLRPFF